MLVGASRALASLLRHCTALTLREGSLTALLPGTLLLRPGGLTLEVVWSWISPRQQRRQSSLMSRNIRMAIRIMRRIRGKHRRRVIKLDSITVTKYFSGQQEIIIQSITIREARKRWGRSRLEEMSFCTMTMRGEGWRRKSRRKSQDRANPRVLRWLESVRQVRFRSLEYRQEGHLCSLHRPRVWR